MTDFEKLNLGPDGEFKEPDLPIPSYEEQKRIVDTLQRLEDAGKLTPELLSEYMTGKRNISE